MKHNRVPLVPRVHWCLYHTSRLLKAWCNGFFFFSRSLNLFFPQPLAFGKLFIFLFCCCWAESEQRLQAVTQKAAVSFRVTCSLTSRKKKPVNDVRAGQYTAGVAKHTFFVLFSNQCLKMDKMLGAVPLFVFGGSDNFQRWRMKWNLERQTRLQWPPGYSLTVFSYNLSLIIFIFTCQYETLKMLRYYLKRSNLYQML